MVNLTSGGLSGGYRKYLGEVVPRLRNHPSVSRVTVYAPETARAAIGSFLDAQFWPARSPRALTRAVRSASADVIFVPTARHYGVEGIPTVTMVRNMEPLTVPLGGNAPREAARNLARRTAARRAARRSRRVIAVSQHVRSFLVDRWGLSPDSVGVVAHGVGMPIPAAETARPTSVSSSRPFFFAAGSIRPARGLDETIEALRLLRARGLDVDLVIGGQPDAGSPGYQRQLFDLATRAGLAHSVVWAGHLTPAEMGWCFNNCRAFVMSSRAEACPNLVLEAMSYGCASISTDQPPMPEFFANAAEYYPAGSVERLATAMGGVLRRDDAALGAMKDQARRRAADFDWQVTVDRTVQELELALDSSR